MLTIGVLKSKVIKKKKNLHVTGIPFPSLVGVVQVLFVSPHFNQICELFSVIVPTML